jgi:hypothetical protein
MQRPVALINAGKRLPTCALSWKLLPPRDTATATMASLAETSTDRFPKITEAGLEDLRRRIGVKITDTVEPWNYEATRDAIRHYAHGIGDDNPL